MREMSEVIKRNKLALSVSALWRKGGAALCSLLLIVFLAGCAQFPDVQQYEPNLTTNQQKQDVELAKMTLSGLDSRGSYAYRIQPADSLEIKVFGYEKMDVSTVVGIGGRINFPPLGEIQAAGLTQDELENTIEKDLEGDYLKEPKVSVYVREAAARNITILGEVGSPGAKPVLGEMRLLDFFAQAGSPKETASPVGYLLREPTKGSQEKSEGAVMIKQNNNDYEVFRIYFADLLLRANLDWNVSLFPGDIIVSPPAGSVYVAGPGIREPGVYPLTFTPKTLRQMIDEAGGLTVGASRDIVLARNNSDNETEFVKVNYNTALIDSEYDILMESGDRVVVVTTFWRYTLEFVKGVLTNTTANYRVNDDINTSIGLTRYLVKQ